MAACRAESKFYLLHLTSDLRNLSALLYHAFSLTEKVIKKESLRADGGNT
jgi:hypothetical protein